MLIHWYRLANWLYRHHIPFLPKFLWEIMYVLFNSSLPASCTIGKGTVLAYGGIGIVVHARAVIGRNCMIGQNTTIGGKSGWYEVPVIGDNVHISAGARILGPVRIGTMLSLEPMLSWLKTFLTIASLQAFQQKLSKRTFLLQITMEKMH